MTLPTAAPRVAFKTVGCRLNQAETARMAAQFTAAGYDVVSAGAACEVAVIHSCTVTGHAERDSLRAAQRAARLPDRPLVVLAGCAAQAGAAELRRRFPAFLIAGQEEKFKLPALVHAADPGRFPLAPAAAGGPLRPRFETTRALIKVQDGCDFGCAYCIVPRARGAPRSRPLAEVLDEVRGLAAAGFREVVLTGANLGCYRDGRHGLAKLIRCVEDVPEVARIRLSSIEITTTEREVIDLMADSAKLCHFLHLPLQSGSDRILAAMGRRYRREDYRAVADYAVRAVPRLGLGTDILVGFPGEDDAAFLDTVRLVEELPFSNFHVFPYSRRPGTTADTLSPQVPAALKKERVRRLLDIERAKRRAFADQFLGRPVSMLVERVDAHGQGRGWTGEYLEARVDGTALQPNRIVEFTPAENRDATLYGCAGGK